MAIVYPTNITTMANISSLPKHLSVPSFFNISNSVPCAHGAQSGGMRITSYPIVNSGVMNDRDFVKLYSENVVGLKSTNEGDPNKKPKKEETTKKPKKGKTTTRKKAEKRAKNKQVRKTMKHKR